ncbi:MAG: hypothetical protein Q9M48_01155 [Rhodobacterales bacterium]|nr:hypothetical protein [Rhodobacterales bacterium]
MLQRRSLKVPFDTGRAVEDSVLVRLRGMEQTGGAIGVTNDGAQVEKLRALTRKALEIEIETPRTYRESVDLFRIGKSEINENPDGINFGGPLFDSLAAVGMFTRAAANDRGSSVFAQGVDAVMANVDSAMGYVWVTTAGNRRVDQLNAGRDYLRINLATTGMGVGLHPISQALQEYPEMGGVFGEIHKMLAAKGHTIQMLGRLGYADQTPPTPRWPVDAKIKV